MTSLSYWGSIPWLILQAQVRGPGQVLTFPYLTKVYSFQGHPNWTYYHHSWQTVQTRSWWGTCWLLGGKFIFQAVKTLVTISTLLLKIYDTCGWTLEDMDTLSQSGCTVRHESIWRVKKKLLVMLSPRDSEHMHFWKRWSISDTYESDSAWPLTMVQSEA